VSHNVKRFIFLSSICLASVIALSLIVFAQGGRRQDENRPPALPSIQPPPGWKSCPRCQNNEDRRKARVENKVEGHAFDPHNLSGVWGYDGVGGDRGPTFRTPPPLTEWGKQRQLETVGAKNARGEPMHSKDTSGLGGGAPVNCDPMGYPRLYTYNYGFEFLQLPDRTLQFFELNHTWRTIWTDGRKLPENPPEPHWLGWNIGHWDGDTFVVESTGFDERSWIDGVEPDGGWPHSDQMRVVERYRRVNYGTLEVQLTVTDPKTYTQPWVTKLSTIPLVSGTELWENFCVPSDYNTFTNDVYLPATGEKK
jgi:hypothetical protein